MADQMARVHTDAPPDFVVTVGDNIYPNGVDSAQDPRWTQVFESVYRGGFWDEVSFYPTLGNHDRLGSPEAQVEYSNFSARWEMPAFYYPIERDVEDVGKVRLLALDTDPIDDKSPDAGAQLRWIAEQADIAARWRIAFGHHPFLSSSYHGGSDDLTQSVLPILRGKVDLFLAGHDHIIELLVVQGLPQAVCGGGAGEDKAYGLQPGSSSVYGFTGGGWCYVRIYRNVMTLDLIDAEGRIRYRHFIRWGARPA